MAKFKDITGLKFNRLTVISRAESIRIGDDLVIRWNCLCECGNKTIAYGCKIRSGHTRSCGCQLGIINKEKREKRTGTPEYAIWQAMIQRCKNKNNINYKSYGGRGIDVCDEWLSFDNFLSDMGRRPKTKERMTIERVNVNKNYEPGNCIWASYSVQNRNLRSNVVIEHNGQAKILQDWANEIGITGCSLQKRIKRWGIEKAITTPKVIKK